MNKITVTAGALAFTTDGEIMNYKGTPVKLVVGSFEREQEPINKSNDLKLNGEDDMIV